MKQALPALFLLASACGGVRTATVRATAGLIEAGVPAFHREADPVLASEAMPAQLKLLEMLLESDPENAGLLRALTEGFTGYTYLFLEEEAPDRARELYRRAAGYGLRLLALHGLKGLETASASEMERRLADAEKSAVPGLFWTAYAWSGWANLDRNNADALAVLPKAARLMERSFALDPGYQFGGAEIWLGVYYASRPTIGGGDPEKAKAYFESALKRSGRRFLTAQLLFAQYQSVASLDEEGFKTLLAEVAAADPAALPEARLANEVAKRKSAKLLARFDELF